MKTYGKIRFIESFSEVELERDGIMYLVRASDLADTVMMEKYYGNHHSEPILHIPFTGLEDLIPRCRKFMPKSKILYVDRCLLTYQKYREEMKAKY